MNWSSCFNPPATGYPLTARFDGHFGLDYTGIFCLLSRFFDIQPLPGETIATDGKVLRGSYEAISNDLR